MRKGLPSLLIGCLTGILLPGSIQAQAQLGVPRLGYIFDRGSGAIHGILGVPGAALLGPALPGGAVESVAISPSNAYALASGVRGTVLLKWPAGALEATQLTAATPSRIVLSPTGGTAVLMDTATQAAEIWTGLPDSPQRQGQLHIADRGAVAVSDDGSVFIAGRTAYLSTGEAVELPFDAPSAIAFRPGRVEAAAVAGREIYAVSHFSAGPRSAIAAALPGSATAIVYSRDGSHLYAAQPDSIRVIRLESAAAEDIATGCTPSRLAPLEGNSVFYLEGCGPGARMLHDDGVQPRILFVPAQP